tara:strand:+ start:64 stop:552 length:489 start_codon:yes stop_codon:yes gene_type:complete
MVVVTNLNRRLDSPADKAFQEGKPIAKFITGPTRSAQDFQAPNPFLGKFKTNPRSDSFYQMFEDPEISQQDIDSRVGFYGNTFEGINNQKAQEFVQKYIANAARTPEDPEGLNSAEGKQLIEPDRIVRPENLAQLSSQPAAGSSGVQDPNVTGKFPSNSVAV